MEPNTFQENNVHQLYPGGTMGTTDRIDTVRDRDSWGVMFEKLSTDMTNLWERQSRLISTEINEKVTTAKAASISMIVGGVLLLVGVLCLAATAIIGLGDVMDNYVLAAAIVTAVLMLIGFVMVKGAQKKIAGRGLVPEQSIEALGQIKNTFQERIHEFKRQ
jgi:uncharacterized membrane protein YqjE